MIMKVAFILCISLFLTTNAVIAERGYAKIENGTLHTDHGDLIRGCHSHMMGFAKEKYQNLFWWQALRDKGHLNCVRMMAYNSPSWYGGSGPGVNTSELGVWLDIAVENAAMAGMYIIIDDHSYCCGGKMPINNDSFQHGIDFWNYVSQRYGKYSHVIFEIKNEPPDGAISSNLWTTHTKALYKIIRQYAPNTPVITHTPGADNDKELIGGISKCRSGSDSISYSPNRGNALVAWHGYGTGDINSTNSDLKETYVWQAQKIAAVICDEFGDSNPDHGYDMAKFLEDKKVSWIWLCLNEMEFGSGTSIKTGYDWVKYPPTWSKDPYAKDMSSGPSGVGGGNNCTVNVSKSSHSFLADAGNTIVTVTTIEGFIVSDNQDWISLSKDGNNVMITVTENTGSVSRSGTVIISGCGNKTINVTQEGQRSTGITELYPENKLYIFPNPVNGQVLNLKLDFQQTTPVIIEIYNVTGQLVLESITLELIPHLNLNGFHKGIYLLRVRTEDKIFQQKFIID
jgi:hypothetical protein